MKPDTALMVGAGAAVLLVLLVFVPQVGKAAGDVISGDNDLTRNARDADGNQTAAYVGQGVLGTAGAAANEASGGWLATAGGWIGRTFYDLVNPDPMTVSGHTK